MFTAEFTVFRGVKFTAAAAAAALLSQVDVSNNSKVHFGLQTVRETRVWCSNSDVS
jgi:hypothetical protein